ncbi:uncharacterized protein JCM10292_005928 [Rhodotorula paludigena]|uniref:uncharacterized protein n=1 Tax=Rhodotorula paludigena TaxID=86838 RepID=UPI00317DD9D5
MTASFALLALAATDVLALAFRSVGVSTSPVAAPSASLTLLDKRQQGSSSPSGATLEEAARSYEGLLVQGAQAVSSSDGECRQPCLPFVMATTDCANQGGTLEEIGLCSCEASQAARVCGNCLGEEQLAAATDFRWYCRAAAEESLSSATQSAPSASASAYNTRSASSGSSTAASATASGADPSPSSSSTPRESPNSRLTAWLDAAGLLPTSSSSSTGGASPTSEAGADQPSARQQEPGSGAGNVKAGAWAGAAAVAFVVALV